MTLVSCLIVTAIVWTISIIRSVRLRAFVYSLPVPMTVALLFTQVTVDGAQLIGIVLLNVFFVIVAVLYHRRRWNILLADLAGITGYIVLSVLVSSHAHWPLLPTLAVVLPAWVLTNVLIAMPTKPSDTATAERGKSKLVKFLVALGGALLTVGFGSLLQGMVITFPYAGVVVAVESRHELPQFARHFARNCIGMIVFLVVYYYLQDGVEWVALLGAWAAFWLSSLLLSLPNWIKKIKFDRTLRPAG